jgi:tetratricopeptide (TPR) repeat protein
MNIGVAKGKRRYPQVRPQVLVLLLLMTVLQSCLADVVKLDGQAGHSRSSAQHYLQEGAALLRRNDFAGALQMFDKSIAADPTFEKPLRGAGLACLSLALKDKANSAMYLEKAKGYANTLIGMDHVTLDGHYLLAMALHFSDPREAIAQYKIFMQSPVNPKESTFARSQSDLNGINLAIGYCYGTMKDYKNCLLYFKKYLALCANDPKCASDVKTVKGFIPQLQTYLKYTDVYEPSSGRAAAKPNPAPASKPTPERTPPAAPNRSGVAVRPGATPPAAHGSPQVGTDAGRREYEKVKQDLERAFEDRNRQIEMLTG